MQKGWRSHSQFNKRQISRVIHLDGSFIDPDICCGFQQTAHIVNFMKFENSGISGISLRKKRKN